jgi:hypothetical protein
MPAMTARERVIRMSLADDSPSIGKERGGTVSVSIGVRSPHGPAVTDRRPSGHGRDE